MSMSDYWEATPHEFFIYVDGYCERIKQEHDEGVSLAYMTAVWVNQWMAVRFKKQPESLEKILNIKHETKEMTAVEMLSQIKLLNEVYGGEVS